MKKIVKDNKMKWVGTEPDDAGGIPIEDPVYHGQVSYIKDRIDEIHLYAGLSELREDLLESMREWLQEILDNWPNQPNKEASDKQMREARPWEEVCKELKMKEQ